VGRLQMRPLILFLRQLTWLDLLSRLLPVLCIFIFIYTCVYAYVYGTVSSAVDVAGSAVEAASGTMYLRTCMCVCIHTNMVLFLRQMTWLDLVSRLLPVLYI